MFIRSLVQVMSSLAMSLSSHADFVVVVAEKMTGSAMYELVKCFDSRFLRVML
jgi:hypothetical protein